MSRRKNKNQVNLGELILFVLIILCVYFILALFDSALTGDSGKIWGEYLRKVWGGASIVPLLFLMYLCTATLLKFRVPRIPRQILGTIQLYISFAFLLGLLKETGWETESTLFLPGSFGHGLARFFVLNIGTFITLLLVVGSFIFSAFLFGSRIFKLSLPSLSSLSLPSFRQTRKTFVNSRRRSRKSSSDDDDFKHETPDDILFMKKLKFPTFKPADDDKEDTMQISFSKSSDKKDKVSKGLMNLQMPKLKPAPEDEEFQDERDPNRSEAVEKLDNIIAMIDSGALEPPVKKRSKTSRPKKIRRPLPEITFPEKLQEFEDVEIDSAEYDEPVFPPPMEIFGQPAKIETSQKISDKPDKQGKLIVSTLKNFGVTATLAHTVTGLSIIQYQLELAPGTKVNKVSGLSDDLTMALAVMSVRVEAPIPGTHYVGIEIPNDDRKFMPLRNVLESQEYKNSEASLPLPLGVLVDGKIFVHGLEDMPHLLISGDSGSGKNTFINSCILSITSKRPPEELRLILIDPRHIEFAVYNGLPHLLSSPLSNSESALKALQWACDEMEKRTGTFAEERVRNLAAYNKKVRKKNKLPEIVIIINELSDLMYSSGNEFEDLIVRLAQKAGAAGIYMILSARRPSADVITTLIRSNIPARISFTLTPQTDSKNIMGIFDSDKLIGKGDMLFRSPTAPQIFRLQTPFISEEKVSEFVEYMSNNLEASELKNF